MCWIVFSTYFILKQFGKIVCTCCIVYSYTGSNNLSIFIKEACLSVCLSVCLFVCLFVCLDLTSKQTTGCIPTKLPWGNFKILFLFLGWHPPPFEKTQKSKLFPYGPGRRAEYFCSTFCGTISTTFERMPKMEKEEFKCKVYILENCILLNGPSQARPVNGLAFNGFRGQRSSPHPASAQYFFAIALCWDNI